MGLRPSLGAGLRAEIPVEGVFRWDSLEGLTSRDVVLFPTTTQLALISPDFCSRCTFFEARGGVVWSCDM